MQEIFFDSPEKQPHGFTLDFKRVLARAIRFWYLLILSLGLAVAIAFYNTRYSQRVYSVSASILIRETQETGGAELLYKNALIDPYRNYLNEPYIIKSYPLIESVIRDKNFHVRFYREGYFLTTEAYNYIPVTAQWCDPNNVKTGRFIFKLVDENHFSLISFGREDEEPKIFSLNDSINFKGYKICVTLKPGKELDLYIGEPFLLDIDSPTIIAGTYITRLQVDWAEEGVGVINLGLIGTNPTKEIDFLNGLIQAYRDLDLEKKNETADRTIEFIRNQLHSIKDSLRTVEFQLERFGNNSRIKDMSAEAQRLFAKVEGFEAQRAELLIRQNYFLYLAEYLSKGDGNLDQIILPSSVGLSDPVLSDLLKRMIDLQFELKLYSDPEKGKNPIVQSKLHQIADVKGDVQEAIKALKSTDKIKMDFIIKQLSDTEKQLDLLPVSERHLISIQRNYSLLENLYVFLMQKLSEAGISKASNTSDILPVNNPMQGPIISPKPLQNYTIAVISGLAIPLIIFIIFEVFNTKVQSKEDIERMTQIPFIGGLGHNTSSSNLSVYKQPRSGLAESFRSLRSNLNFFTANQSKKVFMVTSSISGEGKTFTTINLATVFALSGKKTLIVGADMRRPRIFEDFKRANDRGLSTFLSSISTFNEVVQSTEIENLFLVSGGPVPPNPSELLLTPKFEEFINKALEQFEFVLIDTPPLALVTDAFVMSKYADHTVFVMRQNYSPKDFVRSIDDFYRSDKMKNISILLNDIYKSGLGYGYGYHYGYGYGYGYGYYGSKKHDGGYYED